MSRQYWTTIEERKFQELFPITPLSSLLEEFPNRSLYSLRRKARRLGIHREIASWVKSVEPLKLADFELGFVVGMLEGEGTISIYYTNRGRAPAPKVFWVNTNWELLAEIKRFLNNWGVIYNHNKMPDGNRKQSYTYGLMKYAEIEEVLRTLEPHLIGKRRQAQLVLEYLESRKHTVKQTTYRDKELIGGKPFSISSRDEEILEEFPILNARGVMN